MKASKTFARPFAVALGIAAIAAVPANAADVVFQEPPQAPMAPMEMAPVATWTGPYLGVALGYGFAGRVSNSPSLTDEIRTRGFHGGVFGGYNFQDGMMVYGGEADINFSRLRGTNEAGDDARARVDGSLRARLGVAVNEDILLYGTGGVAAERLRVTPVAAGTTADTNMMIGLTAGVGMDARLTDQVFGRVEYRYTHYGSRNFNFGADNESINSRNHRVSAGIGVRF
jgi:outer membrane immunogenic protein